MTGMKPEVMRSLFTFRPAIVGAPLKVNGAIFSFFYSLHTIPCIGFVVRYLDKSIYFSGDTYYDPEAVSKKFIEAGDMTKERFDDLMNMDFKFNHDVILHEAGVYINIFVKFKTFRSHQFIPQSLY